MPTDELVEAFLKGDSRPVEVEAIKTELDKLWQAAADSTQIRRECQGNLLVYSPHEGAYERAAVALAALARHHPYRAIVLMAKTEAEENEISAYISAHLQVDEKKIGCEQITIIAKGHTVDQLAEIAAPLIVENLPVTLWWQGDLPEESAPFEKLLQSSQKLIFDSADGHDVGNMLSRALSVNWQTPTGEAGIYGDLNWRRLSPYRDFMAQFLESPLVQTALHSIHEVTIEAIPATEGDVHFAQPFLLLGWLASRLNWKLHEPLTPASESAFRTSWQSGDKEVVGKILLHKSEAEHTDAIMPGDIFAARLHLDANGETMIFSLQRDLAQPQIKLRIAKGEQTFTQSTESFSSASTPELLAQTLAQTGGDEFYENALRIATQLI